MRLLTIFREHRVCDSERDYLVVEKMFVICVDIIFVVIIALASLVYLSVMSMTSCLPALVIEGGPKIRMATN